MRLLVATSNAGKIVEIEHELAAAGLMGEDMQLLGLKDLPAGWVDVVEDRPTFVGNATKKARHFAEVSGCLTLADDSGLCVDALGGGPEVLSARYAGEPCDNAANNAKLLREMAEVPEEKRTAHFACAMALAAPLLPPPSLIGGTPIPRRTASGAVDLAVMVDTVEGRILHAPRGTNGFGYDPLFFFPEFGKTTAELDLVTKGRISHRGKALRRMIGWMTEHAGGLGMYGRS